MYSKLSLGQLGGEERNASWHNGRFDIGVGETVGKPIQAKSDCSKSQPIALHSQGRLSAEWHLRDSVWGNCIPWS